MFTHRLKSTTLRLMHSKIPTAAALVATISTSTPTSSIKVEKYKPRFSEWPYKRDDFERQDERPDTEFYASPKMVTHVDDRAIERIRMYYDEVLPTSGRVLDFCSSWISHYPERVGDVWVMGLNERELESNVLVRGEERVDRRIVQDLNSDPEIHIDSSIQFDAATCCVSIDYLTKPLEILSSLHAHMRENGKVHIVISNRAFWHKTVKIWMKCREQDRLNLVGDYLHFSGWKDIEIVDLAAKEETGNGGAGEGWMSWAMGKGDPVWVVRGTKRDYADSGTSKGRTDMA